MMGGAARHPHKYFDFIKKYDIIILDKKYKGDNMSEQKKTTPVVMVFCYEGLILDEVGKYFQPENTSCIEGFVELEIPENPEIQFFGPQAGFGKIQIAVVDVVDIFGKNIQVKPYEEFNNFEIRVLEIAVKKGLITFDKANDILSLKYHCDDVQSSVAAKTVRKRITGGMVKVQEDSACLKHEDEFSQWSKTSKEVRGFVP